ncbi:MAG TPA: hypothetical protein VN702_15820 [Acetobacteraceae bacterium]|nr:hypothetical protein [Acetobacteraceae bacterium]
MQRRDQEPRQNNHAPVTPWGPIMAAVVLMFVGCFATFLFLELDALRPRVGDMVVFEPNGQGFDEWQLEVSAADLSGSNRPGSKCTLDPNVMAAGGGSLVVEARQETTPLRYRLHWAGVRTAKGTADCGSVADLAVSRDDLQRLANAAGGFGVARKTILR